MINSFLLIGQSNMAGRGNMGEVDSINNTNVLMFRRGDWVLAKEPIHTDKPKLAGVGLAMSFADELQKKSGKTVGLIPCSLGGTSLEAWKKGGELYSNAVDVTLDALKNSNLKGILWHQGEGDSGTFDLASTYKERFLSFINLLSTDLGCKDIPIIIGELGEYLQDTQGCTYWLDINKALMEITKQNIDFEIALSCGLKDKGDKLHFDSQSLRELGMRYADAWVKCSLKIGAELE